MKEKQPIHFADDVKSTLLPWFIVATLYCGLLLIEAFFYGGDVRVSILTLYSGLGVLGIAMIVYFVFPTPKYKSFVACLETQLVFLIMGSYLKELDFYFFIVLLCVGIMTFTKHFWVMALYIIISIVINVAALIFLIPRLEWVNGFRFFMQFTIFLFSSFFMLIQAYRVLQRESKSVRALAAFSSLLQSTPNLMAVTDSSRKVLYISDQMAKFIKYPYKEYAIGQPMIDLIKDRDLKMLFADLLDTEGLIETVRELSIDGEPRYFKFIADKFTGESDGSFIDIADITSTVQSRLDAEKANKSKTAFLANMSHEIRTPMNAINGMAEMLLRGNLPEELRPYAHDIKQAGNNLLSIINDLLDISKIEAGKLEIIPVNYILSSLLNDTVNIIRARLTEKSIIFKILIDETIPNYLIGDETRLRQICLNILSNAVKYTEKGIVIFSVIKDDSQTAAHLKNEDGQVWLKIEVSDTGIGIKPDDLKELFTDFTRVDMKLNYGIEGTGLGLAITKKLCGAMGGSISVKSEYGKGSTFTIRLPQTVYSNEPIGALENFSKEENEESFKITCSFPEAKILVVDDIDTNLKVAEGLLSLYEIKTDTCLSGEHAIELVKNKKYDLVLMDHMMPHMDGIEAAAHIREWEKAINNAQCTMHNEHSEVINQSDLVTNNDNEQQSSDPQTPRPSVPIIALTANAVVGMREKFIKEDFNDFLAKPIDIAKLDEILNRWIPGEKRKEKINMKNEKEEANNLPDEIVNSALYSVIDVKKGIANIGGKIENYKKVLATFYKDAENKLAILQDMPVAETVKNFVTNVHALKSALATIGAFQLSAKAKSLEDAGSSEDFEYIKENLPVFNDELQKLIGHIQSFLG